MALGNNRNEPYKSLPVHAGFSAWNPPALASLMPVPTQRHDDSFFRVNTTLPINPRLVDRSKLPNGKSAADYNHLFSRIPKELERVLRSKGNLEVSLTIDESGQMQRVDAGSKNAPKAHYVSAMIKMEKDGSYRLAGIWGGHAGGGNNGAAAAMVTSKMMSTAQGRKALATSPVLDAADYKWGEARMANTGSLNRDPFAWSFSDRRPSTFIPFEQGQTYGVHRQTALGEHHSKTDTWGCTSGNAESFRARLNSRILMMAGGEERIGNLGLQNTPQIAAKVFQEHRALAASTLGKVYQLNPLMYDTGNTQYAALARKLNVAAAPASAITRAAPKPSAHKPEAVHVPLPPPRPEQRNSWRVSA